MHTKIMINIFHSSIVHFLGPVQSTFRNLILTALPQIFNSNFLVDDIKKIPELQYFFPKFPLIFTLFMYSVYDSLQASPFATKIPHNASLFLFDVKNLDSQDRVLPSSLLPNLSKIPMLFIYSAIPKLNSSRNFYKLQNNSFWYTSVCHISMTTRKKFTIPKACLTKQGTSKTSTFREFSTEKKVNRYAFKPNSVSEFKEEKPSLEKFQEKQSRNEDAQ